jgi:N-methylhydantoinase A
MDLVHVKSVIVPPFPGLFSALGLLSSNLVYADSRTNYVLLDEHVAPTINEIYSDMEASLKTRLGDRWGKVKLERSFDARLFGQTWETPFIEAPGGTIDAAAIEQMIANFHETYEERNGNRFEAIPVQGVTYRLQATVEVEKVDYRQLPASRNGTPKADRSITLRYIYDEEVEAGEYQRSELEAGATIEGPAVIREPLSTTQIGPDQTVKVGNRGELIIESNT